MALTHSTKLLVVFQHQGSESQRDEAAAYLRVFAIRDGERFMLTEPSGCAGDEDRSGPDAGTSNLRANDPPVDPGSGPWGRATTGPVMFRVGTELFSVKPVFTDVC